MKHILAGFDVFGMNIQWTKSLKKKQWKTIEWDGVSKLLTGTAGQRATSRMFCSEINALQKRGSKLFTPPVVFLMFELMNAHAAHFLRQEREACPHRRWPVAHIAA